MIWITETIISLSEYRFSSGLPLSILLLLLLLLLFVSTVVYGEGTGERSLYLTVGELTTSFDLNSGGRHNIAAPRRKEYSFSRLSVDQLSSKSVC